MKDAFSVIGQPLPKIDAWAKVTGETRYADDLVLPRMAYGKLLRSPTPMPASLAIDTERARALPGVYAVITGHDLPRVKFGILPVSQDEEALCTEKVRMVGDAVAAVAAVDEETAEAACRLIDVTYEPLPALMSIQESLAHPEVRIHEYGDGPNVHKNVALQFGDVDAAFASVAPGARGRLLLRGQHAPADGAACRRRPARRRRQAHALVLDPDAALRPPAAGQDPGHAGRPHPRDRRAGRRRLRRQARPVRPRDRRLQALPAHRPAGQDRLHARGGLLHPPRAPPGADVAQDRLHEGRRHHGQPHPDLARRRGLRLLRRGLDVLHRRDQPGDVQDAGLQVRGRPRLHQQAAVWPQAWSRHPAAALRARMPARQGGRAARPRPGRPAPAHRARAVHQDRQPPDRDDDRARRVHRQGRRSLGVARQAGAVRAGREPARGQAALALAQAQGHRHRRLLLHDGRGHRDLLEQHAALRRRRAGRSQRRRHDPVRRHRHRAGIGLDPGVPARRGAGSVAQGHPRPSRPTRASRRSISAPIRRE